MLLRYGYDITIEADVPTPMVLQMSLRPELQLFLRGVEEFHTEPVVPFATYTDRFGNACRRLTAPAGPFRLRQIGVLGLGRQPEPGDPNAQEMPIEALPNEVLPFLMPSRYCDSDLLLGPALDLFGSMQPGWSRVQSIMDWVHGHISFNYQDADATRTAHDAFQQGKGVCRDFAHLGIAMCRALNIPARYVNAHLGDIDVPRAKEPMDYAASVEVYLSGRWWSFDPRNNARRAGRIPLGYGRDATDVGLITSFGAHRLLNFTVITEEVDEDGNVIR